MSPCSRAFTTPRGRARRPSSSATLLAGPRGGALRRRPRVDHAALRHRGARRLPGALGQGARQRRLGAAHDPRALTSRALVGLDVPGGPGTPERPAAGSAACRALYVVFHDASVGLPARKGEELGPKMGPPHGPLADRDASPAVRARRLDGRLSRATYVAGTRRGAFARSSRRSQQRPLELRVR